MTEDRKKRAPGGLIGLQMQMLDAVHASDKSSEARRQDEAAEARIAKLERRVKLLLKASTEHATRLRALERGNDQ